MSQSEETIKGGEQVNAETAATLRELSAAHEANAEGGGNRSDIERVEVSSVLPPATGQTLSGAGGQKIVKTDGEFGASAIFQMDAPIMEIPVDATVDPNRERMTLHAFKIPIGELDARGTDKWLQLLLDRENGLEFTSTAVGVDETEPDGDDVQQNRRLYRRIIYQLAGFRRVDGGDVMEFQNADPALVDKIVTKTNYAEQAIESLLSSRFRVIDTDEEEGVSLDGDGTILVREFIGPVSNPDFTIDYLVNEPDPEVRDAYELKSRKVTLRAGSRDGQTTVYRPRLLPAVRAFDEWVVEIKNAVVRVPIYASGQELTPKNEGDTIAKWEARAWGQVSREYFLSRVWPTRKRGVVKAVCDFRKGRGK